MSWVANCLIFDECSLWFLRKLETENPLPLRAAICCPVLTEPLSRGTPPQKDWYGQRRVGLNWSEHVIIVTAAGAGGPRTWRLRECGSGSRFNISGVTGRCCGNVAELEKPTRRGEPSEVL